MNSQIRPMVIAGGLLLILAGCTQPSLQSAQDPKTPGATGRTVVIGSNSTIANDKEATYLQQKWPLGMTR